MRKITIVTSSIFDEMVDELGINAISDLDITEELDRHEETEHEKGRIETWDYEKGMLEVFIED